MMDKKLNEIFYQSSLLEDEEREQEDSYRRERRAQRRRRMRLEKERQLRRRRAMLLTLPVVGLVLAVLLVVNITKGMVKDSEKELEQAKQAVTSAEVLGTRMSQEAGADEAKPSEAPKHYEASFDGQVDDIIEEEVMSTHAIVVDVEQGKVLAAKEAKTRISPASMTKILTVLVAVEHIEKSGNLEDRVPITRDITDYAYSNDCSAVGFSLDEEVSVRDLLYGTVLSSGADAAVALAKYVAGSQEAFVEMMNEKLEEMGLSESTHMTNCVGLYDEQHYSTVYDMAMIIQAAMDQELCKEVMHAHTYTTSSTTEHPDGITISNWFLRRIEDKEVPGEVLCAKTGFVVQSGNCAASYGENGAKKGYICVTANAHSSWRCIYDHVALYSRYMK